MARRYATSSEVAALTGITDGPILQTIVDATKHLVSLAAWGKKASDGHLFAAAHFATRAMNASSPAAKGPVAARSFGSMSESYAVAASSSKDGDWGSTAYGGMYLQLRASVLTPRIVGRYP